MSEQLAIEDARRELDQMFGSGRDYEIRLRNWGYPYLVLVMSNTWERLDFKGATIGDVMDQVRAWHKEQSKICLNN